MLTAESRFQSLHFRSVAEDWTLFPQRPCTPPRHLAVPSPHVDSLLLILSSSPEDPPYLACRACPACLAFAIAHGPYAAAYCRSSPVFAPALGANFVLDFSNLVIQSLCRWRFEPSTELAALAVKICSVEHHPLSWRQLDCLIRQQCQRMPSHLVCRSASRLGLLRD